MRTALLLGFVASLAFVDCQRRPTFNSNSNSNSDDDTLQVFGVRPDNSGNSDSGSSVSFSVTDAPIRKSGNRRGSGTQSGRFTSGGQVGSSSNTDDDSSGSNNNWNGGNSGTGFNRAGARGSVRGGNVDYVDDTSSGSGRVQPVRGRRTTTPAWDSDDSFTGHGDDGSHSGSSGRFSRFPANVRIEVQITRLDDQPGITAKGGSCDYLSKCDPKLYAVVDTESPQSPWPGVIPEKKFPKVFQVNNNNSPTVNTVVTRDVCGNTITQVNLRVKAVDAEAISAEDLLSNFECVFPVTPASIASDVTAAQWGPEMQCRVVTPGAYSQKIKLWARQRAYQIVSGCNSGKF